MVAYLRDASPITPTMGEGEKQNTHQGICLIDAHVVEPMAPRSCLTLLPSVTTCSILLPDTCEWQSKVLRKQDLH